MINISSIDVDELAKILEQEDEQGLYRKKASNPNSEKLRELLKEGSGYDQFENKSVLGIDIYQYSQFHELEQTMVPFLFQLIYKKVASLCLEKAGFIFQKYEVEDFSKQFINTGDGGFQIFETPLHSVVYALHFEMIVRYYNAFQFYPKLRNLIGPLNLRYAMTRDKVFRLDENFYGPSIISNNRILSKDSLNRFLIDENTFNWFMLHMSGPENLQFISIDEIRKMKGFEDYTWNMDQNNESVFPQKMDFDPEKRRIISTDIQKIGTIHAKNTAHSIYNLHLQYIGGIQGFGEGENTSIITFSLGNLNTSGIS